MRKILFIIFISIVLGFSNFTHLVKSGRRFAERYFIGNSYKCRVGGVGAFNHSLIFETGLSTS
jgi:hypothetical protein